MNEESELIGHGLPCDNPKCNSSDAVAIYSDGHSFCFSCNTYTKNNEELLELAENMKDGYIKTSTERPVMPEELQQGVYKDLPNRKISKDTCKFFGVQVVERGGKPVSHLYPYYTQGNELVAQKIRLGKGEVVPFKWEYSKPVKSSQILLFGQQNFPAGSSKYITITEGELDALAAYQMSGSKYPVVSIKNGASGAKKDLKPHLEYLESFENVFLCFDNDKAGKEAVEDVVSLFSPGKAKVVSLKKHKDPCDYLANGDSKAFIEEWWKAEVYTPEGLVLSSTLRDKIKEKKQVKSFTYPWNKLNELTYGFRAGELIVITAPPKCGKTQVLRECSYHLLKTYPDLKIGGLFIEETPEISAEGLMSLELNKRLHLPNTPCTEEEWEKAFEAVLGDDRLVYFDAFGCNDVDSIIQRIRWMNKSYGCEVVFLDHISMLAADHKGDERKTLDYAALALKKLTMETGLTIIIVAHENREGKIHGTSSIEKLANLVIELDRDKVSADELVRNTLTLTVSYNRFNGEGGPAGCLFFQKDTGRLIEIEPEEYYARAKAQDEDFDGDEQ